MWAEVAAALRDDDTEWLSVDGTCVRASVCGRGGGEKKADGTGGQAAEALGRSRGGFGTEGHAAVTPLGHPVALESTGGEAADSPHLPGLTAGVAADAVLADKGYDSDANRVAICRRGAEPCIPPRRDARRWSRTIGTCTKERNVIERYFAGLKQYCRVATLYDKKAANFLGFVWVAGIATMLA